jgi:hypothetical protein
MMMKKGRRYLQGSMMAAAFAWTFALGGCNIIGPAHYLVAGGPKVDAEYNLVETPTLVYIDDRSNVVNPISLRKVIADRASADLMTQDVLKTTISSQDAMTLAAQRERNSQILSIEEIASAVGARQVIYVEMVQFHDTPDGFTPRPVALCRVKVIDLDAKARVYPPQDADLPHRELQVMTREVDPALYASRGGRLKVFEALAEQTGAEVAKLFYKHEQRPLGENLNSR